MPGEETIIIGTEGAGLNITPPMNAMMAPMTSVKVPTLGLTPKDEKPSMDVRPAQNSATPSMQNIPARIARILETLFRANMSPEAQKQNIRPSSPITNPLMRRPTWAAIVLPVGKLHQYIVCPNMEAPHRLKLKLKPITLMDAIGATSAITAMIPATSIRTAGTIDMPPPAGAGDGAIM
jgi:hypothetical protein